MFFQNIDFPLQTYTVAKLVKINVSPILKYCLYIADNST